MYENLINAIKQDEQVNQRIKKANILLSFSKLSLSFQKLSDSGFEWDIRPIVACVVNAPGGGEGGGAEESGEYVRPSDALWQDIE